MTHIAVNPRPKENTDATSLRRAAQYVRMSTEHQQYSIENQSAAIALYAAAHNLGIMRSFVDPGKTGMTIRRRKGLQDLIQTVEAGEADFTDILVYDVSRWGRFPDTDESAYYEYLCKRAGVRVQYCAELFENDNSPTSNLLKALKRTMASEYSRELSVKVSAGQRLLASMGFWQGGYAPFGMMRQLVDHDKKPKGLLKDREWKSISTDRVTLVPGPPEAIRTIRLAFDLYTKRGRSRHEIVEILNKARKLRDGSPWTIQTLRELLIDPVYKGAYAYGKWECRCHQSRRMPRDNWVVRERAFPAIVSEKQWMQAEGRMRKEIKPLVDAEMLDDLRRLWKRKGRLNSDLINEAKDIPSAVAYRNHFGGVNEAYRLIGYPLPKDYDYIHAINLSREISKGICEVICAGVRSAGGTAKKLPLPHMVLLNGSVTVHVSVCKGWVRHKLNTIWRVLLGKTAAADVMIVARLMPPSRSILDYFVIPSISQLHGAWTVREKDNDPILELYRCNDLQSFIESFRCFSLRGAA
jgi:DNA invertase Pin-like site-specific DNA recombinase